MARQDEDLKDTPRRDGGGPEDGPRHEVSVCVCTFRRPALLERLLLSLQAQRMDPAVACRIIVVDNDDAGSAEAVVERLRPSLRMPVQYGHEPVRSISRARNLAVSLASGDLVAFIDDDEFPGEDWLARLVRCHDRFAVNGVLGPVLPHYERTPPPWIVKSRLCERPSRETGADIGPKDMRTGNALVERALFLEDATPFDLGYGTIGGSDVIFFERMVARGRTFKWCNEAVVYESVTEERLKGSYYVRRALSRGAGNAQRSGPFTWETIKSLAAAVIYTPLLPFSWIAGKHVFMRLLVRDCDHIGRILGLLGIKPVSRRPYESVAKGES
jgi:glycosyltransferase involved in cell wall biosynthesis